MPARTRRKWMYAAAGAGALLGAAAIARRARAFDLAGRVVLITGGSRGLGLVLAREMAAHGARIAICARDEGELAQAELDLLDRGASDVFAAACDVTQRGEVERLVCEMESRFGRIDVLVNNAGMITVGPSETMTIEDYEQAMNTNFWGPLHMILAVLPIMRRRGEGRIANISSIGGKIGVPHLVPYSASKFALVGLSRGLRAELARENIVVSTICPGLMRTGSPRNADFKGQHHGEYAWFAISDSLPFTSISAERAARRIIQAIRYGEAEAVLSAQAKAAVKFDALFPEWSAAALSMMDRMLPDSGGASARSWKGHESESAITESLVTALTRRAAERNNEISATTHQKSPT